jgi:hypothetical protein
MLLSLLPVLVSGGLAFVLGYLFWADAIEALGTSLESSVTLTVLWGWLEAVGLPRLKAVLPHVILLLLLTPAVVVVALAAVSFLMAPALVRLVARKRFPDLQMSHVAPWWHGVLWTLWSAVLAVAAMVISVPMWMIPPLLLVLPPLIWGWLTYRVMAYDALALHAPRAKAVRAPARCTMVAPMHPNESVTNPLSLCIQFGDVVAGRLQQRPWRGRSTERDEPHD